MTRLIGALPSSDGDDNNAGPLAILGTAMGKDTTRLQKMMAGVVMGQTAMNTARGWKSRFQDARQYTVSLPNNDGIYDEVQAWLLDHLPESKKRALSAQTSRKGQIRARGSYPGERNTTATEVKLYYDSSRTQKVWLEGHLIRVSLDKDHPIGNGDSMFGAGSAWSIKEKLTFSSMTEAGRDAVIRMLLEIAEAQAKTPPKFYVSQKYGGWSNRNTVMERPMDSVIIREGTREGVINDFNNYLSMESTYAEWGIPWHRGYLFHGVPGTGKTSLAAALASHFSLDIYYLMLAGLESDSALLDSLSGIEERSILVLEDVDIVHASHDRTGDDDDNGVTLAGLLNGLDGFITPHGLITIMTTNNLDVLDPALIRPGRVDYHLEIGYVDDEQLERLCVRFLKTKLDLPPVKADVVPAAVVNIFKENFGDNEAIVNEIAKLVAP